MPARPNFALPSMISGYQEGKEKIRKRRSENAKAFQDYIKYLGDSGIEADAEALQNWAQLQFGMDAYANPMFSQDALESIATATNEKARQNKLQNALQELKGEEETRGILAGRLGPLLIGNLDPENARKVFEDAGIAPELYEEYAPFLEDWANKSMQSQIDEAIKQKWVERSLNPDADIELHMKNAPEWLKEGVKSWVNDGLVEKRRAAYRSVSDSIKKLDDSTLTYSSDEELKSLLQGLMSGAYPGETYEDAKFQQLWRELQLRRDVAIKTQDVKWTTGINQELTQRSQNSNFLKSLINASLDDLTAQAILIAGSVDARAVGADNSANNPLVKKVLIELQRLQSRATEDSKRGNNVQSGDAISSAINNPETIKRFAASEDPRSAIESWARAEAAKRGISQNEIEDWVAIVADEIQTSVNDQIKLNEKATETSVESSTDLSLQKATQVMEERFNSGNAKNEETLLSMTEQQLEEYARQLADMYSSTSAVGQLNVDANAKALYRRLQEIQKATWTRRREQKIKEATANIEGALKSVRSEQQTRMANNLPEYKDNEDTVFNAIVTELDRLYYIPNPDDVRELIEGKEGIRKKVQNGDIGQQSAIDFIVNKLELVPWYQYEKAQRDAAMASANVGVPLGTNFDDHFNVAKARAEQVVSELKEYFQKLAPNKFSDAKVAIEKNNAIGGIETIIIRFRSSFNHPVAFGNTWNRIAAEQYIAELQKVKEVIKNLKFEKKQIEEANFDASGDGQVTPRPKVDYGPEGTGLDPYTSADDMPYSP
ncbi:MAG: hypothetical protein VW443_00445 [Pseudomonadales bacterium]